ncbi:MAG: DUF1579 family protein [Actinobacteria bacterium]|nr:DUF1579 family protein [Actinomycetota bacterium]
MAQNASISPEPEAQPAQPPRPNPDLKNLDRLVGTWNLKGSEFGTYGEIKGQVTFEWMEGGFFLVQHVNINYAGQKVKGIEIIGHERKFGEEPSEEIKSRFYDNMGNTLDYVYEVDGDTLTIWGGEKGSPAHFKSKYTEDGNTSTGRWEWPGGGYEVTATRVK